MRRTSILITGFLFIISFSFIVTPLSFSFRKDIFLINPRNDLLTFFPTLCNTSTDITVNSENNKQNLPDHNKNPINLIEFPDDWDINTDTSYENETIYAYGNITISSISSLSLLNVSLFAYGNIAINNSSSFNIANSKLYFMGNSSKEIKVEFNSTLSINKSSIAPHENYSTMRWIISSQNSYINVYHSQFRAIGTSEILKEASGAYLYNSTLEMLNSTIEDAYTAFIINSSTNVAVRESSFINLNRVILSNDCTNISFGPNIIVDQIKDIAISLNNISKFNLLNSSISESDTGIITILINNSNNIMISRTNISRGINIENSKQITLNNNRLIDPDSSGENEDYGIYFFNVNDSIIKNNLISGLEIGVTAIGGYGYGISIQNGLNITIQNNEIRSFQGCGVKILAPINISFSGNLIHDGYTQNYYDEDWQNVGGGLGVFISSSIGTEYVYNNTISDLPLGIYFYNITGHEIYYSDTYFFLNNFENENDILPSNLISTMGNNWNFSVLIWNSSTQQAGNYWAKYTSGEDLNNDSIIDDPYNLSLTIYDYYPLFYPNIIPKISYELSHTFFIANRPYQNITWSIDDNDAWIYNITENSSNINNGLLNDTRILNTSISSIEGSYIYSCLIIDYWNNKKEVNVTVEVEPPDNDAPVLEGHNIALSEVEPLKNFVWNCTERYPDEYIILINKSINSEELIKGSWTTKNISFDLGNLFLGYYELNITLIDLLGNRYSGIYDITVTDDGAVIKGEETLNASQDYFIDVIWEIYDRDSPILYNVFQNKTLVSSNYTTIITTYYKLYQGYYYPIGIQLRYRFLTNSSSILLATYNITIQVNNVEKNSSTTYVHIFDTSSPIITADANNPVQIDEFLGEIVLFNWNCSDVNPFSYNLSIYSFKNENSTIVYAKHDVLKNNSWFGGNLTYELVPSTLNIGNYRFDVNITDLGNNTSSATSIFSIVDNKTPVLETAPNDYIIVEYEEIHDIILEWNFTDAHPANYQVWRNNTYLESIEWNGSLIKIQIVEYLWDNEAALSSHLAYYELTIVVIDQGNNLINDTVGIDVQDNIKPEITNPPDNETVVVQSTLNDYLNFTVNESLPDKYYLSLEDNLIDSKSYNISLVLYYKIFPIGKSKVNLTITDQANNIKAYIFNLTLLDETPPILLSVQNNQTLDYPNTRLALSWRVFDIRPYYYSLYINETLFISDSWNDRIYITINLNIGRNFLRLSVYDTSNNEISDEFIIAVLDKNAPIIHYFDPTTRLVIYKGQDVYIRILAEDEDPDKYYLLLDDEIVAQGVWIDEINLNLSEELTIGVHIVTVILFDGSGNNIKQSIEIEVITTTTLSVPKVNKIFGMDQRSFSVLIGIIVLTTIILGIRKIRGRKKKI